jgi:hypothetical protein
MSRGDDLRKRIKNGIGSETDAREALATLR